MGSIVEANLRLLTCHTVATRPPHRPSRRFGRRCRPRTWSAVPTPPRRIPPPRSGV